MIFDAIFENYHALNECKFVKLDFGEVTGVLTTAALGLLPGRGDTGLSGRCFVFVEKSKILDYRR